MKLRFLPPMLLAVVALAGCGGGGSKAKLNAGDVAVVNDQHVTLTAYNQALAEEKANLKAQGQAMPKTGSSQYTSLQTSIVDALVQDAEFAIEAKSLGITVSQKEINSQLTALKKQYFGGSETKYQAGLKAQGFTNAEVVTSIQERLLQQKLFNQVTKDAKATKAEIASYYAANISQYQKPASRRVREILAGKNKQTLANQIYTELKAGTASFAALAKKYSQDPGSKNSGGLFTAQKGDDVPEFDAAVFAASAKTNVLLKPVNTSQYGWFVIQPLGPIVPAAVTPESKAAAAIAKTLDSTKQQAALSAWVERITKQFCGGNQISYATGYAPSPDPCSSLTATSQTTT